MLAIHHAPQRQCRCRLVAAACFALLPIASAGTFTPPTVIRGVTLHNPGEPAVSPITIVLDGTQITDVGRQVAEPVVAHLIDARGLHAYPAFIDADGTLGVPDGARTEAIRHHVEDEQPDPREGPLPKTRDANRRGIQPQFAVRDHLATTDDTREAWQRQGFAAVLAAPRTGLFGGSSTLTLIADAPLRRSMVRPDFAQHLSFKVGEPGTYPAQKLGIIASMRQFLTDVAWYDDYGRYLQRHPDETVRLPVDPALAAMHAALEAGQPIIFEANQEVEIHRALDLAEAFNLRIWISGGKEAYRAVNRIRAARVPVLATLAFDDEPRFGRTPGGKPPEPKGWPDEARYEPRALREERRRLWEEQVSNVITLIDAGVLTAISSRGLEKPDKLLPNLRKVIQHGLPPEMALSMLTHNPAQLFGLADRWGRIDRDRAAHLVLMSHPLEDKRAKVRYLFVAGKMHDFEFDAIEPDENKSKQDRNEDDVARGEADTASPTGQPEAPGLPKPSEDDPTWRIERERDRRPQTVANGDVLVRDGTVLTVSGARLEGGDVLIRRGKIKAIGRDVPAPPGVTVIDAKGHYIMPGIIDCHSHMALDAVNESALSISAEVRVGDVIDHRQVAIYRALAGGVTTIHTMHGSANTIGGENVVLKLRYGRDPEELRFAGAPRSLKFALGENVTHKNAPGRRGDRFPVTRMGVESVLRQALIAADAYRQSQIERVRDLQLGMDLAPLRQDLRLETLAGVLAGDVWVHCHGYRADEYLRLIAVAEDFGFRVAVLQHVLEGYRIRNEIARHGCGASTFSNDWAYKIEALGGIPYNAAEMTRAGVNVSVNSDSANTIRYMNLEAGKSMRWGGLSAAQALRLITLHPAMQLGIADQVGSLEVGKDGDLALFNGHPLDSYSQCVMTLVDGRVYFEHPRPRRTAPPYLPLPPRQTLDRIDRGEHQLYAIVKGTVHPVSGPPIENGTVLIRNDRLDAVGRNVPIPPRAIIVDASGKHVYPGFIDAGGVLGLSEVALVSATRDAVEAGNIHPEIHAASGIHPHSVHIPVTRSTGITMQLVRPGGGWIRGQSTLIALAGQTVPDMQQAANVALHLDIPSLPVQLDPEKRKERLKTYRADTQTLETFMERSRLYTAALDHDAASVPRDLRLEAMVAYHRGEKPVILHAQGYKDILDAVAFADAHGLRFIISGGRDAWKCAELLARKRVPVIIDTVISYPGGPFEPFDAVFANAAVLDEAGVPFCFASGRAAEAMNLPIHAALAVAHGLEPQRALYALTLGAARILEVDEEVGSLEPGKRANLFIATGDPLQVSTAVTAMFINGKPVDLQNLHTRQRDRFRRPPPVLAPAPELRGPPPLFAVP